ncbi:MAG: carboxypeptidase-like regulatory domain-containing protein [Cytophagales bacterium]|nr:carboxypeptidase-like regulatory domain-containing protein [Cytophagales bacterium]
MVRFLLLFILGNTFLLQGQDITQSVTGKVKDISTFTELVGASISIFAGSELITGASTDSEGQFKLILPSGRYRLVVSFTGYVSTENELLVIAGKMQALEILLQESPTLLAEVVVSPESISEPGVTSLSIEKTLRAPANFFDPVRMLTSYPGVVTANDQANSIIVKGYSPNGILWRLQGLDIINPNHTANAGTLSDKPTANGGGVSVLSAQILDRTDFYSGNLPARYGNALAGVMNMSLRSGSTEKMQYTAQASLIGIDLAAEGPFSKKSESSFLVNYRYSTVGLLSQVGVDFGDEAIGFQDLSFHLNFPGKRSANLSVFGFGGLSKNEFDAKPESEWEEEKDRYTIDYDGKVYGVGFVNQFKPGWLSFSIGASLSGQEQNRTSQGTTVPYPAIYSESYFSNRLLVSTFVKGVHKINNGLLEAGVVADYLDNQMDVSTVTPLYIDSFYPNASGTVNGMLWQPYANWTQYVGNFTLNAGMRYVNFGYNTSDAWEPRLSISGNLDKNSITLSYSATSQWQQVQTYITQGNDQLPFTKSNQFAIEWRRKFNTDISVVSSIYYHELNNVPIVSGSAKLLPDQSMGGFSTRKFG